MSLEVPGKKAKCLSLEVSEVSVPRSLLEVFVPEMDGFSSVYSTLRCERVTIMGEKLPDIDIANIDIGDIGDADNSDEVIVALRTVQQSQVRLNVLADQKANINIGFTLLFITLSQSPVVLDSVTTGFLRWGLILITVTVAISSTALLTYKTLARLLVQYSVQVADRIRQLVLAEHFDSMLAQQRGGNAASRDRAAREAAVVDTPATAGRARFG